MTCKDCIKADVCKYNDGHNLWCKGECPKYKNEYQWQTIEIPKQSGKIVKEDDSYYYQIKNSKLYLGNIIILSPATPLSFPKIYHSIGRLFSSLPYAILPI